jgi:hypothetical protein
MGYKDVKWAELAQDRIKSQIQFIALKKLVTVTAEYLFIIWLLIDPCVCNIPLRQIY